MLFILLTGLVGLAASCHFALRALPTSFGFIKTMMLATLFGTLAASCADEGTTLYAAARTFPDTTQALQMVLQGTAESTSPGILGFSLLGLTAMLTAVGRRRAAGRASSI